VETLASDGLRVLAVAKATFHPATLPPQSHDFDFELLGVVGLEDPIRPSVPAAIQECRTAGVRVVMITGDYPVTAARIAREIGLPAEGVMTGAELEAIDDRALAGRLGALSVFARVVPAQKLRLVNALKSADEVVVMTGDGVNDAPALKAAHIGIAMGGRGTDVAREAAALVLLEDDFSSIVVAIGLGRRIFDNLKKAMTYLVAVHVPIAGMALFPVLFGWPLLLMPIQIVFLELIIDPASSIAFEAEPAEKNVMRRPPRSKSASLLSRRTVLFAVLQGAGVLAVVLAFYGGGLARGVPLGAVRGATFAALIVGNLGLILANRSSTKTILGALGRRNPVLWWIVGSASAMLALVLAVPGLRDLFRFSEIRVAEVILGIGAGAASLVWLELLNLGRLRVLKSPIAPI
jgi:Ca2+-transporting ATPase